MNQQKIWDAIAEEWHEFKQSPSKEVIKFLDDKTGNILDLGGGSGRHLVKIKHGKMYIVDFSEKMLKLAKQKSESKKIDAEFIKSELDKMPFQNNFFDAAISIAAIHCLETKEKRENSVKEFARVLKQNSEALISVWDKDSIRFKNAPKEKLISWRDKGKRYYYLFDEKEIHDLFKKHGFKIKQKLKHSANVMFIVEKI